MDIILLERVGNLGNIGDVVTVKDGFARNFLLPNKKALRANDANKQVFENNRERLEKENAERREAAEKEGSKIDDKTIELIRQASNTGQLYGSVAVRDIIAELEAQGEPITKKQVVLERPIKTIGMHDVRIALHPEVEVILKVNVARSPEEAEKQAQGIDIIAEMFEQAQADIVQDFDTNAEPGEVAAIEDEGAEDAAVADGDEAVAGEAAESETVEADAGDTAEADAEPEAATDEKADKYDA